MAAKTTRKKTSQKQTGARTVKKKAAQKRGVIRQEKQQKEPELSGELNNELVLLITLVVSILLLLSNFGLSGKFGEFIHGITFGLFGFLAYLIPFLLFFGIAFYLANRKNSRYLTKLLEAFGLFAVFSGMIQLAVQSLDTQMDFTTYVTTYYQAKNGGGLLGAVICRVFVPFFGTIGSYIVLAALEIVFLMLMTGKALFALLSEYFKKSMENRRTEREQMEELLEEEPEQQHLEFGEPKAQSFLLKTETEKEEKPRPRKKNFFGGVTPTIPFGETDRTEPQEKKTESEPNNSTAEEQPMDRTTEKLVYNGTYTPSRDTVDTVNQLFEEEIRKKFDYKLETPTVHYEPVPEPVPKPEPVPVSRAESVCLTQQETEPEPKASPVQEFHNPVPAPVEPFEPSFSEQSLSDRRRMEGAPREKTIFEQVPYGLGTKPEKKNPDPQGQKASAEELSEVAAEAEENTTIVEQIKYRFPPVELLAKPAVRQNNSSEADMHATAEKLRSTLESFGVRVTITNVSRGPSVTRYELQPEQGVKVSRITNLADDIKLNLAAADVRIEAPIPGKAAVGIEVPNKDNTAVFLRELIESKEFEQHPSDIAFTVGKDIGGQNIIADIGKMPHLLIAGATGSGKSVCINTIIMSILYKADPSEVKLIMVDPKVVELSIYNGIPHLLIPVVTDPKKASAALNWAVAEMTDRYQKFAELNVRDIKGYNEKLRELSEKGLETEKYQKLPRIVIIVDELADLMMVAPGEVEDAICRLAQMARAAGLHLILATQRPSVNVITGLIKANVPSRIAFAVSSGVDSRTILDGVGAEKLLGKGDMLFFPSGYPKPVRIQGAFVSDKEVASVVDFLKSQTAGQNGYNEEITSKIAENTEQAAAGAAPVQDGGRDEYFAEAGRFIIEKDKASIGMLQRVYKIGFNRAARIMDQLSEAGVVGPEEGTKPRKILMTAEEFEQFLRENG